jgi:hypothetical protein
MNTCGKSVLVTLALALAAGAIPAYAADASDATGGLGRLFLTPAQRLDLDKRRQADAQDVLISVDNFVTANGQVSRSGGKSTTWINGKPQHDLTRSRDPARVLVPNGEDQPPVPLKIGETYDKVRGDKRDVVGEGQVRVPASKR